jgi:hypothetical protein
MGNKAEKYKIRNGWKVGHDKLKKLFLNKAALNTVIGYNEQLGVPWFVINRVKSCTKKTNLTSNSIRYNRVFVNNRVRYNRVSLYVKFQNERFRNFNPISHFELGHLPNKNCPKIKTQQNDKSYQTFQRYLQLNLNKIIR